jgi:hypothetical protein
MGSSTSRVLTRTDSTPVAGENKERVSSLALLVHPTIRPRAEQTAAHAGKKLHVHHCRLDLNWMPRKLIRLLIVVYIGQA